IQVDRSIESARMIIFTERIASFYAHLILTRPLVHSTHPLPRTSSPLRFLERILAEAESAVSPGQLLAATSLVGLIALAGGIFVLREMILAVQLGLIGEFLPICWIRAGHKRTLSRLKSQLPDTH